MNHVGSFVSISIANCVLPLNCAHKSHRVHIDNGLSPDSLLCLHVSRVTHRPLAPVGPRWPPLAPVDLQVRME